MPPLLNVAVEYKIQQYFASRWTFFPVWFFTAFGFEGRVTATKAI
jgi:hypothetical protein